MMMIVISGYWKVDKVDRVEEEEEEGGEEAWL